MIIILLSNYNHTGTQGRGRERVTHGHHPLLSLVLELSLLDTGMLAMSALMRALGGGSETPVTSESLAPDFSPRWNGTDATKYRRGKSDWGGGQRSARGLRQSCGQGCWHESP